MVAFQKDEVIIRPARADDADVVAPLIYSAGPEMYDYWLTTKKHEPLSVISAAFKTHAGIQGYGCHWVAEVAGEVLGVVASYTGQESHALERQLAFWLLKYFKQDAPIVAMRGLKLSKLIKPIPNDLLFMANLGVSPKVQGRGVGTKLLRYHQQRAKTLSGVNQFGLDVANNNPSAQRLYERLGMVQVWERVFTDLTKGIPSSRRMSMSVVDLE